MPPSPPVVPTETHTATADGSDSTYPSFNEPKASSGSLLKLVQLRVQAQGALLRLAPHNIRYNELIGEGINSAVLKQLYEEVGIKVPTTPSTDSIAQTNSNENVHPETDRSAAGSHAKKPSQPAESQRNATPGPAPLEASSQPSKSVQTSTAKPMERKEVIARMLAAKTTKSSPASAAPEADSAQTASALQDEAVPVEKPDGSSPPRESSTNDKESRIKEKNKAQTELAKQRIEQLKKQGLIRNSQKSQPEIQPRDQKSEIPAHQLPQVQRSIVHHPLPERPPLPESASFDQIPGLFITQQAPEPKNRHDFDTVEDSPSEPPVQARSSQRKRPRASDFDDDPIPTPKRTSTNGTNHVPPERLVIDISDEEFYGDDEDGNGPIDTAFTDPTKECSTFAAEGFSQDSLHPIESLPHRPATSLSRGPSASTAPSNNRNEQENLKKKDLAIMAMHRKIAELEQRKKAKVVNSAESPHASSLATPELVSMSAQPVSAPPNPPNSNGESFPSSTDADGLRRMKDKVLRMQEIEAGVPSLDAEIAKSETRLAAMKREEEQLSSELAKGKEGRKQLLDELNSLQMQVGGLSLDHINAALTDIETKQEMPVEVVQGMVRRLSIPGLQLADKTAYNYFDVAPGYQDEASAQGTTDAPKAHGADDPAKDASFEHPVIQDADVSSAQQRSEAHNTAEASTSNPPPQEPSDPSLSDTSMSQDSSSSMDESSDDSSSDSGSSNEDMPDAQDPGAISTLPTDEATDTGVDSVDRPNEPHSERESAFGSKSAPQTEGGKHATDSENAGSHGSSVSDNYEPPEPEESASVSDSSYSPAPSPDFASPSKDMEISPVDNQSQEAGEPLTEKVQELDFQQPSQYPQIRLLDVR